MTTNPNFWTSIFEYSEEKKIESRIQSLCKTVIQITKTEFESGFLLVCIIKDSSLAQKIFKGKSYSSCSESQMRGL